MVQLLRYIYLLQNQKLLVKHSALLNTYNHFQFCRPSTPFSITSAQKYRGWSAINSLSFLTFFLTCSETLFFQFSSKLLGQVQGILKELILHQLTRPFSLNRQFYNQLDLFKLYQFYQTIFVLNVNIDITLGNLKDSKYILTL